jgi:transcription-repair coupling factor (superfamily II helicase)
MQSCLYEFLKTKNDIQQIIVLDDKEAILVQSIYSIYGFETFVLPDIRVFFGDDIRTFSDEFFAFNNILYSYYKCDSKKILITPLSTSLLPFVKKTLFKTLTINFANDIDYEGLKENLFLWGYDFVDLVEVKGEVSFRGDIIDIFPINSDTPFRISTFDKEVDSIKQYDVSTQKSISDELESIDIIPALFGFDKEQYEDVSSKVELSDRDAFIKDISSLGIWFLDELSFTSIEKFKSIFLYKDLKNNLKDIFELENININKDNFLNLDVISLATQFRDLEYTKDYKSLIDINQDKKITIYCASDILLKQFDLEGIDKVHKVIFSDERILISSSKELIISVYREKIKYKKKKSKIILDELKVGDIVVHHIHGIGIFEGIEHTKVMGHFKDYISILYQNEDKLLIPIENLEVIDRYVVDSGSTPVLDKLGKGSFVKLKAKVKAKLLEIADKIVSIAATRELITTKELIIDDLVIQNFQKNAGFDYTDDQIKAINNIFDDFKSTKVMDRLLVGDVGFGKTEVALNAILTMVLNKMQVLFVAPTTLLSNQHYKSLQDRLSIFDIKVAKVNRFVSTKEKKQIYEDFKDGKIDVIIGTHAVFNIQVNNLGLVIIDEEHKFGVKQKEILKNITKNVHLLSMSATPIPRSLNLALSHIKTISYLNIPPSERKPVRTYVKEYVEVILKEAINREMRRGGQIFYIYNHIKTIEQKSQEILEIMPNLKILILHSQIPPLEMEKGMLSFENKEYDLLLCTSIVESGIHIPNANTMIIDGSDRFGLADLHQLRGRVGRSSKEGFCYFFVEDKEEISENSLKRLSALETHSSLGSGSLIARQDLEIRGAGNILGEVQSGHIQGVGYSLYVKMLEESLQSLSNTNIEEEKQIDIKLSVDKFISSQLISEDRLRLDIYRRLSKCRDIKDVYDIEEEINDRFGDIDEYTKIFLDIVIIKILARNKDIKTIMNYEKTITIIYDDEKTQTLKAQDDENRDIVDTILNFLKK